MRKSQKRIATVAAAILAALGTTYFLFRSPEDSELFICDKPAVIETNTKSSDLENRTSLENRLPAEDASKPENTGAVPPEDSKTEEIEDSHILDSTFGISGGLTPGSCGPGVAEGLTQKGPDMPYHLQQQKIDEIEQDYRQGATSLDCIISKLEQQPEEFRTLAYDRLSPLIYNKEMQHLQELLQRVSNENPSPLRGLENMVWKISLLPKFYSQANEVDKKYAMVLQELQSLVKPAIDRLVNRAIELRKETWHKNIQLELELQEKNPRTKESNMKNGCDIEHSYLKNLFAYFKKSTPEEYEAIKTKINSAQDEFFQTYGQGLKRCKD